MVLIIKISTSISHRLVAIFRWSSVLRWPPLMHSSLRSPCTILVDELPSDFYVPIFFHARKGINLNTARKMYDNVMYYCRWRCQRQPRQFIAWYHCFYIIYSKHSSHSFSEWKRFVTNNKNTIVIQTQIVLNYTLIASSVPPSLQQYRDIKITNHKNYQKSRVSN